MSSKRATNSASVAKESPVRPEIFRYHDYQSFLRDWIAYRKAEEEGFSLRALSKRAGLASGYLPMVLSGKRPLTAKALAKISPFLGLTDSELSFFDNLLVFGTTDSHEARVSALDRMKRFPAYIEHNPKEGEVYEYFSHWPYVAVREMASLKDFKLDAEWIQSRLRAPVTLKEVKDAIDFLVRHGFLTKDASGAIKPPEKSIECKGSVFRVALTKFHREIFALAAQSIENTPGKEREIQGHTFSIGQDKFAEAKAILDEAVHKIRALGEREKNADRVYHMEIALFPLTKDPKDSGSNDK